MLASRPRFAAIFIGGLILASCGGGGGTPPMTPLAQSMQTARHTKFGAAHCSALPLINLKTPLLDARSGQNAALSGCGSRASHKIASLGQTSDVQAFDVPGTIKVSKCTSDELFNVCGTFANAISTSGAIVGNYLNSNNVNAAFIRTAGATYTPFQAPGAARSPYQGTYSFQINDGGAVTGMYVDAQNVSHGFVRRNDGSFLTYEAPWASQVGNDTVAQGTSSGAINANGEAGGIYFDAQGNEHGFIRYSHGSFVQVIPKGSTASSVCIACLTNSGASAGDYTGQDGVGRGFIRSAAGAITTIAKPGALDTGLSGINNGNRVVGFYVDTNSVYWGFILGGNKKRIVFQAPKAGKSYGEGTLPEAINDAGAVTGLYADAQGDVHGFYRSPTGRFSEFDPKGSIYTEPYAINDNGTVTGTWYDAQGGAHGFIWASQ